MIRVLKHTPKQWFEGETIMETRKYLKRIKLHISTCWIQIFYLEENLQLYHILRMKKGNLSQAFIQEVRDRKQNNPLQIQGNNRYEQKLIEDKTTIEKNNKAKILGFFVEKDKLDKLLLKLIWGICHNKQNQD